MRDDLKAFFLNPKTPKQKQYEAIRAYIIDGLSAKNAAKQFGFTIKTMLSLLRDLRSGKLEFFPKQRTGPKDRRVNRYIRQKICTFRKQNLSTLEISEKLYLEHIQLSPSSVERILKEEGFGKLPKRSAKQRGLGKQNTYISQTSANLDLSALKPFKTDCQVAGVFFFLPYIIDSGILKLIDQLPLPESERIGKTQAFLSLLCLKLIGNERLSHVKQYDSDRGFGLFAGLNVLPKPTFMITYSCLVSAKLCQMIQKEIIANFIKYEPSFFKGKTINLDFHSIPHFGEKSEMEKVWCGSRNKALKGANSFFAQDGESKSLFYANADIKRKDGAREISHFIDYLKALKGVVNETLVFDSRLTNYAVLDELDQAGIKFITLRRRGKKLSEQTGSIPTSKWQNVRLPIPKRKNQKFLAIETATTLKGCQNTFRQIVMKDHGRAQPTFIVTNNRNLSMAEVLTIYARRWRIENKFVELVKFFNLNALSSPIMVRIFFDLLLTVIADFLYHRFAKDLPRFENNLAPNIFRRFVDMPGNISYDGKNFILKIRKRAYTPILLKNR